MLMLVCRKRMPEPLDKLSYQILDTETNERWVVSCGEIPIYALTHELYGAEFSDMPSDLLSRARAGELHDTVLQNYSVFYMPRVHPYQISFMVTPQMAKLSTVFGVSITVYDDMITDISWSLGRPVKIRLSDFGKECADLIFAHEVGEMPMRDVTIVFDDKISITQDTLSTIAAYPMVYKKGSGTHGIKFDVSEVTNDEFVRTVYDSLMRENYDYYDIIIDKVPRLKREYLRYWGSIV